MLLDQVFTREGARARYVYDYGDHWEHEILLEKVLEPDPSVVYPRCVKGRRACPPEDCGGVPGYAELLEILSDPGHPEYRSRFEWAGGEIDPEHFDLEAADGAVYGV